MIRRSVASALAFVAVAIAFLAFVSWFESPATWPFEARVVAGVLTIAAAICGFGMRLRL